MRIHSKFQAILGVLAVVAVSLTAGCGQVDLQGKPTASDDGAKKGYGTLSLRDEKFPEGAEALELRIVEVGGGGIEPCYPVLPLPDDEQIYLAKKKKDSVGATSQQEFPCPPVVYSQVALHKEVSHEDIKSNDLVIRVKRGEEIKPFRLRAGEYTISAVFSDKTGEMVYAGSEFFTINDGEKKALTIRLQKIESGEVTVGFEVEKPTVPYRLIRSDAHLEIRKSYSSKRFRSSERVMDLDLERGVAVVSESCKPAQGVLCSAVIRDRKVILNKDDLTSILAYLSDKVLKDTGKGLSCANPEELISITLKRCKDCEAGKVYQYDNTGCGLGTHNLVSEDFEAIWQVINSKNSKFMSSK